MIEISISQVRKVRVYRIIGKESADCPPPEGL
jgi:hypothetical protein